MKTTLRTMVAGMLLTTSHAALAQEVPIVLPGAPGEAPRVIDREEAIALADTSYSPGDVVFMQGMITHHRQAVQMAELAPDRTSNDAVSKIAAGILATQKDEIAFMTEWLEARGEAVAMDHSMHAGHAGHSIMKGMATPAQMAELAASSGTDFDRQFLRLMIEHHKGALTMVKTLHEAPGSAYEPVMFEFTNDVVSDQQAEIDRMNALLAQLSSDPRATLTAGLRDAGEAISGLRLVAAQPKPAGFFDPKNPAYRF